jgi:starch synthase
MSQSPEKRPSERLRIVLASSEAVPFSKTGGLADVVGALAKSLDQLGHDVVLMLPDYFLLRQAISSRLPPVTETGLRFSLPMNGRSMTATVSWSTLPGTNVRVLLVRQPEYFDRQQLYGEHGHDYVDNCERFSFFSRAVPEICRQMILRPDIIHSNDWQTGVIPGLLASVYADRPGFEQTASVFTLHNMAFQGRFWHLDTPLTGLDWKYFNYHYMESWGDLNLLKTGIAFADQVTTVSPTYAREICTPEGAYGLEGILRLRQNDLTGILNGIDDKVWNPGTDPLISENYTAETFEKGKAACKSALQLRMGLPSRAGTPLFGMISRMTDQKGFDLISAAADRILAQDMQIVMLGTGDRVYEDRMRQLANRYPEKVSVVIGFDDPLAHQIESGADMFLMPSRFEPCGLNQMYSLRYGTVPIVRNVGGLADSVEHYTPSAAETATGFVFSDYTSDRFAETVETAMTLYRTKDRWKQLIRNGMTRDWSWQRSAEQYVAIYRKAMDSVLRRRRGELRVDGERGLT